MSGREPEAEKLLCVMAGYDPETEERVVQALPLALKGFQAFEGRIETLLLYAFWPARPIETLSLTL